MQPQVSVVVAVYNPGENIDGLVDSLVAQTLPADALEVLFVDDGSTDGTAERLQEVVATRPGWSVTTIPNSGWPGRPRNIGLDRATGEYVFFADHDDELLPEALERMHALGRTNGSDVVYPKLVRPGRPTPYWSLARETLPVADPLGDVLTSRTVHKLYRRQFLLDCGARFPEGRVRLEDHHFSSQVLPRARVVSVVADYPCYRWIHRRDGSNNSTAAVSAESYWGHYTEVLRVAERVAGPGPLLDRLRLVAMAQAFSRLSPAEYLERPEEARRAQFRAVGDLVREQFPADLDDRLPVLKRMRVRALRAGDEARFEAVQRLRARITFGVDLAEVRWDGERLHLVLGVALDDVDGAPFLLGRHDGDLVVPDVPGADVTFPVDERRLLPDDLGTAEVTVRHRAAATEWPVPTTVRLEQHDVGERVALRMHVEADLDPATGAFGAPLEDGTWSVLVRVQLLGESLAVPLPTDGASALPGTGRDTSGRSAAVTRLGSGALAVRLPAPAAAPEVRRATWDGDRVSLDLRVADGVDARSLTVRDRDGADHGVVEVVEGRAVVPVGGTSVGDILDLHLHEGPPADPGPGRRLRFGDAVVEDRPPYRLYRTESGFFSVKHVSSPPAPRSRLRRALSAVTRREPQERQERQGG